MRIVEFTKNRLVIEREHSTSASELLALALAVNVIVSIYIWVITSLPSTIIDNYSFYIGLAVSWLLVHLLFTGKRISVSYGFVVIAGASSFIGFVILLLCWLHTLSLSEPVSLIFDKNVNLLTIKKAKIFLWYPTIQYPFNEIIGTRVQTQRFATGATTGTIMSVLDLVRRKQNGKIVHKDILVGANCVFASDIDKFLDAPID